MSYVEQNQSAEVIIRARRNTLGDLLTRTTARNPDKMAFIFKERKVTYQELEDLVNQTAHGLRDSGIQKGDRLAILSKNSLDYIIVIFAAARLGAVLVPINYMLTEKDISYILSHSEITGMFASETYMEIMDDAAKEAEIVVQHRYVMEAVSNMDHWISLQAVQTNQATHLAEEHILDDDLAQVLY